MHLIEMFLHAPDIFIWVFHTDNMRIHLLKCVSGMQWLENTDLYHKSNCLIA